MSFWPKQQQEVKGKLVSLRISWAENCRSKQCGRWQSLFEVEVVEPWLNEMKVASSGNSSPGVKRDSAAGSLTRPRPGNQTASSKHAPASATLSHQHSSQGSHPNTPLPYLLFWLFSGYDKVDYDLALE